MMTKRDFIALADTIRSANMSTQPNVRFSPVHIAMLADMCYKSNPQFKRQRWLAYIGGECGPKGWTK